MRLFGNQSNTERATERHGWKPWWRQVILIRVGLANPAWSQSRART